MYDIYQQETTILNGGIYDGMLTQCDLFMVSWCDESKNHISVCSKNRKKHLKKVVRKRQRNCLIKVIIIIKLK